MLLVSFLRPPLSCNIINIITWSVSSVFGLDKDFAQWNIEKNSYSNKNVTNWLTEKSNHWKLSRNFLIWKESQYFLYWPVPTVRVWCPAESYLIIQNVDSTVALQQIKSILFNTYKKRRLRFLEIWRFTCSKKEDYKNQNRISKEFKGKIIDEISLCLRII